MPDGTRPKTVDSFLEFHSGKCSYIIEISATDSLVRLESSSSNKVPETQIWVKVQMYDKISNSDDKRFFNHSTRVEVYFSVKCRPLL